MRARGVGFVAFASCALFAAALGGCVTYTPPSEVAEPLASSPMALEPRLLAASEVLLAGYAPSFTLRVVVPEGAAAVRLAIELDHLAATGFRWSGLGACEGAFPEAVAHEVGRAIEGECGALAAGEYTLVLSEDSGAVKGRVSVHADVPSRPAAQSSESP